MLQAYWIDYEVWFGESSAWKYRDWVKGMWSCPRSPNTAMRRNMTAADTASIRVRNMTKYLVFGYRIEKLKSMQEIYPHCV